MPFEEDKTADRSVFVCENVNRGQSMIDYCRCSWARGYVRWVRSNWITRRVQLNVSTMKDDASIRQTHTNSVNTDKKASVATGYRDIYFMAANSRSGGTTETGSPRLCVQKDMAFSLGLPWGTEHTSTFSHTTTYV